MTATLSITDLASEAYDSFETAYRIEGDEDSAFTRLKDSRPDWVYELVQTAHGEFFPDDWRYDAIRAALGRIADDGRNVDLDDLEHEWSDGYVDIYNQARFRWLASNIQRQLYVDEAVSEFGWDSDSGVTGAIGMGQYAEAREVFASVRDSLEQVAAMR